MSGAVGDERMPPARPIEADLAGALIRTLTGRHLTIATAESLTGGLLAAELTRIPGASVVVNGGVIAYATAVKRSLLGVSAELLALEGAVHPDVARQMADGARRALAVDGRPADVGVATTGVAGPGSQDGRPPGTVYLGIAMHGEVEAIELHLRGDRAEIRRATVSAALDAVFARLDGY